MSGRPFYSDGDGVMERHVFREPDGTISSVLRQPSRDAIMSQIQRHRLGVQRKLDWGRMIMQIPEVDLARIKDKYPELKAPDAETRNRAWASFIASSESTPYKV